MQGGDRARQLIEAPPRPPLTQVLLASAQSPHTLPILVLLGAALAWLGTQIPQLHAPLFHADGLSRSELLAQHALGLDRPAHTLLAWLLLSLFTLVILLQLLVLRQRPRLPAIARLLGGTLVALAWLQTSADPPPLLLDVPLQLHPQPQATDLPTVVAWQQDGAGLQPAPGPWRGLCTLADKSADAQLQCVLSGAGLHHDLQLRPAQPIVDQQLQWTLLAEAESPQPQTLDLNLPPPLPGQKRLALHVQMSQVVDAPILQARVQPTLSAALGPLLLLTHAGNAPNLQFLAPPDVLPEGKPGILAHGDRLIRLQRATAHSPLLLLIGVLLLLTSLALDRRARPQE